MLEFGDKSLHNLPSAPIFPPSAMLGWAGEWAPREGEPRPCSCPPPTRPVPPPGYAEPLKEVPREKFNHTAIPKGYRCPWQEFISCRDYKGDGRSHIRSLVEYRNFNK